MKKIIWMSALFLLLTSPSFAFTHSLVDDWSNSVNPNGPWSYNEGINPLKYNISSWPIDQLGPNQTAWANSNSGGYFLPGWLKGVGNPNPNDLYGYCDWLDGDVVVHSTDGANGRGYGIANVTWTSPESGIYDIDGGLWITRSLGRSNDWSLYLDDQLLTSGSIFDGDIYSRSNPNSFNLENLNISAGSVLKLEVVKTSGYGDFVGVNLNINNSVIPEPATIFLFGTGLAGTFLRRKR